MDVAKMYPGMPVIVHFSYERFSPEYSRVESVDPEQGTVTVVSPGGSRRVFRAGAQVLDGDFGYTAYFNSHAQELLEIGTSAEVTDEAEEGLRRYRMARAAA